MRRMTGLEHGRWAGLWLTIAAAVALTTPRAIAKTAAKAAGNAKPSCDSLYFNATTPAAYKAAYQCYMKDPAEHGLMLSLMSLNGEGTEANADKAKMYLRGYVNARKVKDLSAEALEKFILARQQGDVATPAKRVDFCTDVALTTVAMSACQSAASRGRAGGTELLAQELRAATGKPDAASVDTLMQRLQACKAAFAADAADAYRGGSLAGLAGGNAAAAVDKEFATLVPQVVAKRLLVSPMPGDAEAKVADAELNKVYDQIRKGRDKDGQKLLKSAELAWIAYRDAWITVAKAVYRGSLLPAEVQLMVSTYMTLSRTAALQTDRPPAAVDTVKAAAASADGCAFDPDAVPLAIDGKAKGIAQYSVGAVVAGSKSESAILADEGHTKVAFTGGGCEHLGYSFVYSGFVLPTPADKTALVALAEKLLAATPIRKDAQENQHTLLDALAKAKTSADPLDAHDSLVLPCGDGGPGPSCTLELIDKRELAIIYDYGL